jgi:hypothetical protein
VSLGGFFPGRVSKQFRCGPRWRINPKMDLVIPTGLDHVLPIECMRTPSHTSPSRRLRSVRISAARSTRFHDGWRSSSSSCKGFRSGSAVDRCDDSELALGGTGHVSTAAERRLDLAMTFRTLRDLDGGPVVLGETVIDQSFAALGASNVYGHATLFA